MSSRELTAVDYAEQGLSLMARARYRDAALLFYRARASYPSILPLQMNLAIALREIGAGEAAEQILVRIIDENAYHATALVALASLRLDQGETAEAERLYQEAIAQELQRKDFALARDIALTAADTHDRYGFVSVAICFSQLSNSIAGSPEGQLHLGRLFLAAGLYEQVIRLMNDSGMAGKHAIEQQLLLAIALFGSGEHEQAMAQVERLMLTARKRPDLKPEIEVLRFTGLLLLREDKTASPLMALTDEEREQFHALYGGQANHSYAARYWPVAIRDVLALQEPAEE